MLEDSKWNHSRKSIIDFTVMKKILHCLLLTVVAFSAYSEGSKELHPKSGQNGPYLQIWDTPDQVTRKFATFSPDSNYRLNIKICNLGEKVYFGFQQNDKDVYFRIKDPNGNTVPITGLVDQDPAAAVFTYKIPTTGNGFINTWTEATSGPKPFAGSGYNALTFVPKITGDYNIEFNPTSATVLTRSRRMFTYFDATVVDTLNGNTIKKGRLWSKAWDINCNSGSNTFDTKVYVYSRDSVVTLIDFNGMQPFGFVISCNSSGCTNTGNVVSDRQSRVGNVTYPEYKLFLNDPDPLCYPNKTECGNIVGDPVISGCDANNRCIEINVTKAGQVEILLDFAAPVGYNGEGSRDIILSSKVVAGNNCIKWNTRDGLGNIVPRGTIFNINVNYFNGLTHLPLYDVENHLNGYKVSLIRPSGGTCGTTPFLHWDDTDIIAGTALDQRTQFADGIVQGHKWSGRGENGCYGGDAARCPETINTWWYGGSANRNVSYRDSSILVDANKNTVGFGSPANDTTVCSNIGLVPLHGLVSGFTNTGIWSVVKGAGTIKQNPTSLENAYAPGAADRSPGKVVTLKLTATNTGVCAQVSDTLQIFFKEGPSIKIDNAPSIDVCTNNPIANITATKNAVVGTFAWIGGAGEFLPNRNTLNITYKPTQQELDAAVDVKLVLKSTTQQGCTPASDSVLVKFKSPPVVQVASAVNVCKNNPRTISLGGISSTGAGVWSGGIASHFSNVNDVNATYAISAAEANAGNPIVLTLTSANNAKCNAVNATTTIQFFAPPVITAGTDIIVCKNKSDVQLSATASNNKGKWRPLGAASGVFVPNDSTLNAIFKPAQSVIDAELPFKLEFTSNSAATGCAKIADTVEVTFKSAPAANAGVDKEQCKNSTTINLAGATSSTGTGKWVGGTGIFTDRNDLSAKYTPSASEIAMELFFLVLETTNNNICNPARDTIQVVLSEPPVVEAGTNKVVCKNNNVISLKGASVSGHETVQWSASVPGIFTPNNTSTDFDNIKFTPSTTQGPFTITLKAFNNALGCAPVEDQLTVSYIDEPIVSAGSDVPVCKNNISVSLIGTSTTGKAKWSGGAGTFGNVNNLNTSYVPTQAEINVGSVELTLTSDQNGTCNPVVDKVMINFINPPTVEAGTDKTVCANKPTVSLQATSSTNKGTWSGGTGTFLPKADSVKLTYVPSTAETNAAPTQVKLFFTSNVVNNCLPVKDSLLVNITASPKSDAGIDQNQCKNNINITLSASVTGAGGGIWSNGTGSYNPNNTSPTAAYVPSAGEISKGFAILRWTTTSNGLCNQTSDSVRINFTEPPTANAGPDLTVCESSNTVALKGTVTNATGGSWTTLSGATVATTANANYTLTAADKTKGVVTLVFQTTGVGNCIPLSDTMNILITKLAKVNAGDDQQICISDAPVDLSAIGNSGHWVIKSGAGIFSDANSLQTKFTPAASTVNTTVILSFVNDPQGICSSVTDDVSIKVLPGPIVTTVADLNLCGSTKTFNISGTVSGNTSTGIWISPDAQGTIANPSAVSTTYTMTDKESKNATNLVFLLQTTNNNGCAAQKDTLKVKITPSPQITAGPDLTTCEGLVLDVAGTITSGTFNTWSSLGGGVFNTASAIVTKYTPSASETSAGKATIIATTNSNGPCPAVKDSALITIKKMPTVGVPADFKVCGDTNMVTVTGTSSTNAGTWKTNGLGIITPDANTPLKYNYEIDESEQENGATITFTFVSANNDVCPAVPKNTIVTVLPRPKVSVLDRDTVCNDGSVLNLTIQTSHINSVKWSSTGDGIFADANAFTTTYTLGVNDRKSTQFVIINTTQGDGVCKPLVVNKSVLVAPRPEINAGADREICVDFNGSLSLIGTSKNATSTKWFNVTSSGSFSNDATLLSNYTVVAADVAQNKFLIGIQASGSPKCKLAFDTLQVNVLPRPTAGADSNITICKTTQTIHFNGVSSTGSGVWSLGSGTGLFSPKADTNSVNYLITDTDRANKGFTALFSTTNNKACSAVTAKRIVTITDPPVITVNPTLEICESATDVTLNASISNAGGITWKTSGTGVFDNLTSLTPKYTPSVADKTAKKVILTATTTQNGSCAATSSQIVLTITPAPIINGPGTISVCNENDSVRIELTVKNTTGVTWTGGQGVFRNKSDDTTAYYPAISELDAAPINVVLTATTIPTGSCPSMNKNVNIQIVPKPVISVNDAKMCGDVGSVVLPATFVNANGILWTKLNGAGSLNNPTSATNANYSAAATEKTNGATVRVKIQTTGNGLCKAVTDTIDVVITPKPTITNVGADIEICEDNTDGVGLGLPTIFGAEKAFWTASGTGIFLQNGTEFSSYVPTASDLSTGQVTLKITTDPVNTTCKAISATKRLIVRKKPTVDAGPDRTLCISSDSISVSGFISNATGGYWSSDGDGVFKNNQVLTTSYSFVSKTATKIVFTAVGSGVCPIVNDTMTVDFISKPQVDAGKDTTFCTSNLPVKLRASGADGQWQLLSGPTTGTFQPDNTALNPIFIPTTVVTGTYLFNIITDTFGGICPADTDEVTITIIDGPTVALPSNVTICEDQTSVNLTATTTNLGSSITKWVAIGSGSFTNQNNDNTTYNLSPSDLDVGKVLIQFSTDKSICPTVDDTMTISVQKKPLISASDDQEICVNTSTIKLSSEVEGATQVSWTNITTGNNGFTSSTSLTPDYTISNADKALASIKLEVQTTDNGQCGASKDTLVVSFEQLKSLNSNSDTTICFVDNVFKLRTIASNVKSVSWTSNGVGEFDPNNTQLNADYNISSIDKTNGSVKFVINSNDQTLCPEAKDSLVLTILPEPTISFVENFVQVCAEVSDIDLAATISNISAVKWQSSGNGLFVDDTKEITKYIPTVLDKSNGGINLLISSVNGNGCPEVSTGLSVQLVPKSVAVVNAGFDQFQCRDNDNVNLSGIINSNAGGIWSVLGNASPVFLPNDTILTTVYKPTVAEINNGLQIVLSTRTPDICGIYKDTLTVKFTPVPVVDIVSPVSSITICADSQKVDLVSSFTVAKSGVWSTSGKGLFVKSEFDTVLSYYPHPDDIIGGHVVLTYTSKDNGTCIGNYFDTMAVNYTPIPVITGIDNDMLCKNNPIYKLNFAVDSPYPGRVDTWSTSSGLGSFNPNINDLGAVFTADPVDVSRGVVMLTLTTDNNGTCKAQSKNLQLKFTDNPKVKAGIDKSLCENNATLRLNGSITGGALKGLWLTSGSGTFVASATDLKATYIPSAADLAAKQVLLKLMSTDNTNGTCLPVSDSFKVVFTPRPLLNAFSKALCTFDKGIELAGTISGGNFTARWSTNGTGVFTPNKFNNLVQYVPSDDDKLVQNVSIRYRTLDAGNCLADSVTIPIIVTPLPIADAGEDGFVCKGFKDTINVAVNDEYVYDWREIGEIFTQKNSSVLISPEIIKPAHNFELKVTDARGCVSFDTVKISPIENPGMSILPKVCLKPGLTIAPKSSNADPRANYQWYRNGVALAQGRDSILKVNQAGLYTVQYTMGNCNIYKTNTRILQNPVIFAKDELYCKNDTATVIVERIFKGFNTYTWTMNNSSIPETDSLIKKLVSLDTNKFVVTARNFDGCTTKDSAYVLAIPRPLMNLSSNAPGCEGQSLTLNATPDKEYPNAVRTWTFNGNPLTETTPTLNLTQTKYGDGTYIVTYKVDDCIAKDTSVVKFYALPKTTTLSKRFCGLTDGKLAIPVDFDTLAYDIKWLTVLNKQLNPTDSNRVLRVDSSDFPLVTEKHFHYLLKNDAGCTMKDSVIVKDLCDISVYVPTGFTPNGDGMNDSFKVFGMEKYLKNFQLYIFNRWGEVIYKTSDFYNAWDGNYREDQMPVGVYPYVITYELKDPELTGERKQNGKVTIVR